MKGLKRYRNSDEKWYLTLNDPTLPFKPSRTSKDLMDKYRNMQKAKKRKSTPKRPKRRKRKQKWSQIEEDALYKGYQRYKNVKTPWASILADEDFKDLFHPSRDNVSLKDKFRNMERAANKSETDESDISSSEE